MKNDCFAMHNGRCKILLGNAFVAYKRGGCCGNEGCPFYKPKGKEKRYKRGLSNEDKIRFLGL